jgi:membrane protein
LVSLLIGAAIAAFGKWWDGFFAGWEAVLQAIDFSISFVISTVLFAMIYKLMPRAKIAWRDVWIGAAATALLFEIGKLLIGLYLGKASVASGFGAAGSLVVLLVWVYFAAQIFLLGAEFTWAYAHECGLKSEQSEQQLEPVVTSLSGGAPTAVSNQVTAPDFTPGPANVKKLIPFA